MKFCKHCGNQIAVGQVCDCCVTQAPQAPKRQHQGTSMQSFQHPAASNSSFGRFLFEGNGAGTKQLYMGVVILLAGTAISFMLAHTFGHETVHFCAYFAAGQERAFTRGFRTGSWYFFMVLGLTKIAIAAVYGFVIASLNVKVYEGGILGKGVSSMLNQGDIRTFDFMLIHEQTAVSLKDEQTLIIHGPGVEYTVYSKKAREIYFAINQQKGI